MSLRTRLGLMALICSMLAPGLSLAQPESVQPKYIAPWFGSFENNGAVISMTPWEDGIKMVITAGPSTRMVAFARMDGKEYPETGNQRSDGLIFNPIDDNSYEFVGTKDGEIVAKVTITFPPHRMTRVSRTTYLFGEDVDRVSVWKRVVNKGDKPWYGIWQSGTDTYVMEPWEDGFTFVANKPLNNANKDYLHVSGFGSFGDQEFLISGNPKVDSQSFRQIDDYSYEVVSTRSGKLVDTTLVTIAKDGKTRTSVTTAADGKASKPKVWQRLESYPVE